MPDALAAINLAAQVLFFAAAITAAAKRRQGPTHWWTTALGIAVAMTAAHITNIATNPNPAGAVIAALWLVQVAASATGLRYAVEIRATNRQHTNHINTNDR